MTIYWLVRHFKYNAKVDLIHTLQPGYDPIPEFRGFGMSYIAKPAMRRIKKKSASFAIINILSYLFKVAPTHRFKRYRIRVSLRTKRFVHKPYVFGFRRWSGSGMYAYAKHYMQWLLLTLMGYGTQYRGAIQADGSAAFTFDNIKPWLNVLPMGSQFYGSRKFGMKLHYYINFKHFDFGDYNVYQRMTWANHIFSVSGFPTKRSRVYRFSDNYWRTRSFFRRLMKKKLFKISLCEVIFLPMLKSVVIFLDGRRLGLFIRL
jgi:hypothetical protein